MQIIRVGSSVSQLVNEPRVEDLFFCWLFSVKKELEQHLNEFNKGVRSGGRLAIILFHSVSRIEWCYQTGSAGRYIF